jgi:hypothetical protein
VLEHLKELDRSTGRRYGLVQGQCTSVGVAWRGGLCSVWLQYFYRAITIVCDCLMVRVRVRVRVRVSIVLLLSCVNALWLFGSAAVL